MKPIHIFKSGSHTAMSGVKLDFTDAMLQQAANGYSAALHEAPIVVGHPKDNAPAFGWIKGLEFVEGKGLFAIPDQLNTDFADQVANGAYKKVSASLYTPDAPGNPTPGHYYVRHVGFLGAQPPAIKGLEAVGFNDNDEGTLEFAADWETASLARRLREFFIEKFGLEDADKAIPGYLVEGIEDAARAPKSEPAMSASYSEANSGDSTMMTEEQIIAAQAKLEADAAALATAQAKLDTDAASFSERQEAAAAVALATHKKAIGDRVDALVSAGKVLPAKAEAIKDFAEKLDTESVVEFGEGDDKKSLSATDFFFGLISEGKTPVEFGEHGAPGEGTTLEDIGDSRKLAAKALEFQESEKAAGRTISITQAVNLVQKGEQD